MASASSSHAAAAGPGKHLPRWAANANPALAGGAVLALVAAVYATSHGVPRPFICDAATHPAYGAIAATASTPTSTGSSTTASNAALVVATSAAAAGVKPPAAADAADYCVAAMRTLLDAKPGVVWPPPCPVPPELARAYTAPDGSMPFGADWCLATPGEGGFRSWSVAYVEKLRAGLRDGSERGSYTRAEVRQLQELLAASAADVAGKVGMVIGTEVPWVEALLLDAGAATVWTFEYMTIDSHHPRIKTATCKTIACAYLDGAFPAVDFIVSFSSIEHSGLGRYGDGLNPDGDRDALAQAWCMLKPGGAAFIGMPMTCADAGRIEFNAHRVYGHRRLDYIAPHFSFEGFAGGSCHPWEAPDWYQTVARYRKPADGHLLPLSSSAARLAAMRAAPVVRTGAAA